MKNITDVKKSIWVKLAIATAALLIFYATAGVLFPIFVAMAFTFAIYPLYKQIRKLKITGHALPDIVVVILTFAVVALLTYLFVDFLLIPLFKEVNALLKNMPSLTANLQSSGTNLIIQEKMNALPSNVRDVLGQAIRSASQSLMAVAKNLVATTFGVAATVLGLFIVPFLSFYFLKDWVTLRDIFVDLFDPESRPLVYKITCEVGVTLGNYTIGMLKMCLLAGLCLAAITSLINPSYALLMGTLGAMLEMVPYVGPVFCTIMAVFVVFTSVPQYVPHIFFGYIAYYIFDSQILYPAVMNKSVTIPPVVIILSVLLGGKFFGIMGLIFSVPLLCVSKVMYNNLWHLND